MLDTLSWGTGLILVFALALACLFEFANGFHDTANAVATVIYTKSLKPRAAVLWSGFCNFLGVFVGGIGVAMSIVHLLPAELLASTNTAVSFAMVFAVLLSAIFWNLGTWYLGIPASSSHTLIGAIFGVGIANSLFPSLHIAGGGLQALNWAKAREIMLSLLISPLLGFWLSASVLSFLKFALKAVLSFLKFALKDARLFHPPRATEKPPRWVRFALIGTSTGVSFAHGSNDGQKGVGLILLILISVLPGKFALNVEAPTTQIRQAWEAAVKVESDYHDRAELEAPARAIRTMLEQPRNLNELSVVQKRELRTQILQLTDKLKPIPAAAPQVKTLRKLTDYSPTWVLGLVAVMLGFGTAIGWRRIVVTVGERIGKQHLSYAQGASAEMVAMSMIGVAALGGMPVSTTHVLSSGIAGSMIAQKTGVQRGTVSRILSAWVLTLPVCVAISGGLFLGLRSLFALAF